MLRTKRQKDMALVRHPKAESQCCVVEQPSLFEQQLRFLCGPSAHVEYVMNQYA